MLSRLFQNKTIESIFSNEHIRIMSRMRSLGYSPSDRGICFGVSHMAVLAILANEINKFSERLELLDKYTPDELAIKVRDERKNQISLLNNKRETTPKNVEAKDLKLDVKGKRTMSEKSDAFHNEDGNVILGIPAFFDGIELLNQSYAHQKLFGTKKSYPFQDAESVFPFIQSKKVEELGGVENVGSCSGVYRMTELFSYFINIKIYIDEIPFAMTLNDSRHAIAIGYDTNTKSWTFIDVNQFPIKYSLNTWELTDLVLKAFSDKEETVFSTTFYTTKKNSVPFKANLAALNKNPTWQDMHQVNLAKANFSNQNGAMWLDCAAYIGNLPLVKALLKEKIPKTISHALIMAIDRGHFDIAKHLLEKHKEHKLSDLTDDQSSLQTLAALLGNLDIINLLLEFEDVKSRSKNSFTPLIIACVCEHADVVKVLLEKKADVSVKDPVLDKTALNAACITRNLDIIKLLIEYRADVNECTSNGETILMEVCKVNQPDVILCLLVKGANPNAFNCNGATPIIAASILGLDHVINELLKYKAKVNQLFQANTKVLLSHANIYNRKSSVELLLHREYRLAIPEYIPSMTALHMAAFFGHIDVVKLLLKNHADINLKSENGITALQMAEAMGHDQIVNIIKLHNYSLTLLHAEPVRCDAINSLLNLLNKDSSYEQLRKQITFFSEIDDLAQRLVAIPSSSNDPEHNQSLNALSAAAREAYMKYTVNPEDRTIIENLKTKANETAQLVENDYEKNSYLFTLFGKRSDLEKTIFEITHSCPQPMKKSS